MIQFASAFVVWKGATIFVCPSHGVQVSQQLKEKLWNTSKPRPCELCAATKEKK